MECDKCNKPAKVFLTQLVGGQVKKIALCDDCAKENGVTDPTGFALADLLLGGEPGQEGAKPSLVPPVVSDDGRSCPDCGFTLEDLKKVRRFGCGTCYSVYREEVEQMIRGMHKGTTHLGKVPSGQIEEQQRRKRLKDLRTRLEQAIDTENYEDAANLRDEIRKLEGREAQTE